MSFLRLKIPYFGSSNQHTKTMRILYPILLGLFLPLLLSAQWQSLPNPNSSAVRQIMEFNGQLLVSDDSGLARSFDGGVHWQRITSDGPFGQIMPSGQDIYGIKNHPQTGLKSLLKSADTGQSWDCLLYTSRCV